MTKRDAERAARKQLVIATIRRAFDRMIPGRTTIRNIDLVKKKIEYNDNTPIGNLKFVEPFNLTTDEVVLKGNKFPIGMVA